MTDILLTNDDGYGSVGFLALFTEMVEHFSLTAVAPIEEKSWIGKSISARAQLSLSKERVGNLEIFTLNGTPADCVQVGIYNVMRQKPKLVVSGINIGDNAGHAQILSSGTVGAAMEASIDGIKSISASLYLSPEIIAKTDFLDAKNKPMFENAAKITTKVARIILGEDLCPGVDLISLNIPAGATVNTPFAVTVPFRAPYGKLFQKKGNNFVHVNPNLTFKFMQGDDAEEGTDVKALAEGKISVAPLSLELVSKDALKRVERIIGDKW